jgi:hypothetical protein
MAITILERRGLERARRLERVAENFAKQRAEIDKRRPPERQRNAKDIVEESRAKLEKRGLFKRD